MSTPSSPDAGAAGPSPATDPAWRRVSDLFLQCCELSAPEQERLLTAVEPHEPAIAAEVRSLLAAQGEDSGFLESPAAPGYSLAPGALLPTLSHIGPYRLAEEIGRGGMGTVHRAVREDGQFDHEVALKLLRPGYQTDQIGRRFRQERQILARLEHPYIARLLDGGSTPDGRPYLVMELVKGERIDQYCTRLDLPLSARVALFRKVCEAVQHAHQNLVVHRDIKPGNILVTEAGEPKLLDFGIAKLLEVAAEQTRTGEAMCTAEYASPEQVRGEPVSTSSDVYSLGVLLYELLSGRRPYRLESTAPGELERAILHQEPERLSTAVHRTTTATQRQAARRGLGDLDNIVQKALRKEPQARYGSAGQLADDLARYLEGRPVEARPLTLGYQLSRFVARNRVPVTIVVAALVLLVGTTAFALWQAQAANRERAVAERRFREGQEIAHHLLFDVHDRIASLPGALPVREDLVQRSLRYLDRLAADAGDDPALNHELAAAYRRLGLVQGHQLNANKGDARAAQASFAKGIRLAEHALSRRPGNPEDRALLSTLYDDLSVVLSGLSQVPEAYAAIRRSLEYSEALHREQPADPGARQRLAITLIHAGANFRQQNGLPQTERMLHRALDLFASLERDSKLNNEGRIQQGFASKRLGGLLIMLQRYDEAEQHYRRALAIDRAAIARQPQNLDTQFNLTFAISDLAYLARIRGRFDEAVAGYQEVLRLRESILAQDPGNERALTGVARTLIYLGALAGDQRRYGDALRYYERAGSLRRPRAERPNASLSERWDYAETQRKIGNLQLWRAERTRGAERRRLLTQAERLLAAALPPYQEAAAKGQLAGSLAGEDRHIATELAKTRTLLRTLLSLRPR